MKLLHISDLHIGKRLYGYDLEEDQRYILNEIIEIINDEKPDAVLIAGDIYDRADPSATAVRIFDDFLSMLAKQDTEVFIIYGNHDSASRVSYGASIFSEAGIHVSPVYEDGIEPVRLEDEYGPVDIYMLPYLRSADAAEALAKIEPDSEARNVIVSHQFVTSAILGDSEEMNVGSLDNIDGALYDKFDYAALGHIHMPQTLSGGAVRYSGSPLAYSFSESDCIPKSVTVVNIKNKGDTDIQQVELVPLHSMATIKGAFQDIITDEGLIEKRKSDYLRVILTDTTGIMDAMARLQTVFDNVMTLEYEYMRRESEEVTIEETDAEGTPEELFDALYKEQHDGREPNEFQKKILSELISDVWEGSHETD